MSEFKVPKGWKLVPVEPTEEIVDAIAHAKNMTRHGLSSVMSADELKGIYRAILDAAPAAPAMQAEQQPVAWDVFYSDDDCLARTARTKKEAEHYSGMAYYVKPLYYAAPPTHPDVPRCQCCGYLVTQSEHRGCLRSASPHPDASVLVEALRNLLSDDDIRHLRRFQEICEDSDADGHDLPKEAVRRLERAGTLRACGFGRHETTLFGDAILAALAGKGGE